MIKTATKKIAEVTTNIVQVVDKLSGVDNVKGYQLKRKIIIPIILICSLIIIALTIVLILINKPKMNIDDYKATIKMMFGNPTLTLR